MSRFEAARRAALVDDLLGLLRRRPRELLAFGEVQDQLRLRSLVDRGLDEVPLDKIVGSLGRAREFNRAFLPRRDASRERWRRLEQVATGSEGFEPVDLYKVGDAYFVVDGHHRISVARSLGAPAIEARVKELITPIQVGSGDSIQDLVLRRAREDFLEATGLEPSAESDLTVTAAADYERLLEHIGVHRYFLGIESGREVSWAEAVASWRDTLLLPVTRLIRSSSVLRQFPGRTETDLYLFVMDHLHHLREASRDRDHPIAIKAALRHLAMLRRAQSGLGARLVSWWRRIRAALGR
jgi:hypothetical protein